jgi:hypothetical protein
MRERKSLDESRHVTSEIPLGGGGGGGEVEGIVG